jgi:RNA polymerase sporulation-specific sigma factor
MLLAHDETLNLIRFAQQGDREAQERLVLCNTALVKSIVKRYMGRGVEFEDLYQLGCLGLVKAIGNYDESYGVRFSTYAVPMIAGEIRRFLRDDGIIRVSRPTKDLAAKTAAAQESLRAALGREPTIEEISRELGVDRGDIVMALQSAQPCKSLYEPIYDDGSEATVLDQISTDDQQENNAVNRLLVKELINDLGPREKQLIILRYFRDKTQSETATVLGVSRVQISRLESRIVTKLREAANRREMMRRLINKEEFMERIMYDLEKRKEKKKVDEKIVTKYMTPAERIAKAQELIAGGMNEDEAASMVGYGTSKNLKIAASRLGKPTTGKARETALLKQPLAEERTVQEISSLIDTHTPVYTPPPMPEVKPAKLEAPKLIPIVFDGERMTYRLGYQNQLVEFHENNLLVEGHKQYTPTSLRNLAAELLVVADMLELGKAKE